MIIYKSKYIKNFFKISNINQIKHNDRVLFELNLWNNKKEIIKKKSKYLGIQIDSDQNLEKIVEDIKYFNLISFNFLNFKDGRPFTFSRKLRQYYNYKYQIRATGNILPDQYIFLLRCGFDSFEINCKDRGTWEKILKNDSGLYYQKEVG